jgi:hypothetical protein
MPATVSYRQFPVNGMLIRNWKARDPCLSKYGGTLVRFDPHTYRIWPKPTVVEHESNRSSSNAAPGPRCHGGARACGQGPRGRGSVPGRLYSSP